MLPLGERKTGTMLQYKITFPIVPMNVLAVTCYILALIDEESHPSARFRFCPATFG